MTGLYRVGIAVAAVGWTFTPKTHPAVVGFFIVMWAGSLYGLFRTDRR